MCASNSIEYSFQLRDVFQSSCSCVRVCWNLNILLKFSIDIVDDCFPSTIEIFMDTADINSDIFERLKVVKWSGLEWFVDVTRSSIMKLSRQLYMNKNDLKIVWNHSVKSVPLAVRHRFNNFRLKRHTNYRSFNRSCDKSQIDCTTTPIRIVEPNDSHKLKCLLKIIISKTFTSSRVDSVTAERLNRISIDPSWPDPISCNTPFLQSIRHAYYPVDNHLLVYLFVCNCHWVVHSCFAWD